MAEKAGLVTLTKPRGPAAEAYRTLRTNLGYVALEKPLTTLVVTSPAAGEGKSVVVANLAVTLAQSGRKTILVDADLRRPSLAGIFGVAGERGLSAAIAGSESFDGSLLADVGVDGLKLLPSGELPPNPADLLGSSRMEQVIAALKKQAEIVLFDAPPVVPVTDAAVLGAKADGLLLVIKARGTRRDEAERAKEMLERVSVRIVGTVLHSARRGVALGGY
jgi:capsular exopolysaccharide synthesis family protein